jgi:ligand-binding sensor domain-containing protein/serine phosphatase RsbU (regulator of sigma subunit)
MAQSYHFVKITVEDGLSQNEVISVLQDRRGVIWFATKGGGVTIYDGVNYRYLREEDGLSNNIVYCLYEDIKGNIWIGTYDGLNMFDGKDLREYKSEQGLTSNVIRSICEDATGKLWVGTENGGVCVLDNSGKTPKFQEYTINIDQYIGNSFRKIIESSDGKIWMGGNKGLTMIDGNKHKHFSQQNGLVGNYVYDLHEDINGDILVATNEGLSIFDGKSFINYNKEAGFPSNDILCIDEDQKGNIWLGTAGEGLIRFNPSLQEFEVFNSNNGLSEDIILAVLEDASNNIWVGTKGGGVNRFSGVAFTYFSEKDGMQNEKVNAIASDQQGNLWFATREGLVKYDGEKYSLFNEKSGLPVSYCNTVFEDSKENIWLGTLMGVVKIVDGEINSVFNYKDGIINPITAIIEDYKGNIWFGTDGGGLVKYDGEKFTSFSMINGLNSNKVTSLLEDDEHTIWIGTFGGGVSRFNGYEFLNLTKDEGISSNIIYSLTKGPRGDIYIGTKNGITRYENNSILIFDKNTGLSSNNIKMMSFDEENSLWIGSEKGLDRIYFNPPQVFRQTNEAISEIKHYGKEDGIKGGEINPNAVAEDLDGNMWFGTNKGAIKFDINIDDYNSQKPKTYILDLKIDYNHINWRKKGYDIFPWSNIPKNLELPYDTSHVTFSFVGINHKAPDKVRYQWKLEGFDQSYSPLTNQTSATYPKLPPGNYEFKVIACNSDEECNDEDPATFKFSISPPFWQETWFITLIGIIILLSIYAYIKFREKKLMKERQLLEDKVKERTEEVVEKNKQLELVNIEIGSKNKEIEEKNNDLNSSIRYALTIQQASFPPILELKEVFEDSFIYLLPRDIVSGDFYWYQKFEDKFVIAIADCTGHGVPGALMSMIGMTLLNEIFSGKSEVSSGKALNRLDEGIRNAFENSENESNDGMDIALCIIDEKEKTIQYSGAYRPLVIIQGDEIIEVKATKYAIGSKDVDNKDFDEELIKYNSGDCIYMFSDGYPDQFGGPNNKKFKSKVMKEMLLEIHHLPMQEQKEIIDQRLMSWMEGYEQIDDILVSGIRLN